MTNPLKHFIRSDIKSKNKWIDRNTGQEKMNCTICGAETQYNKSNKCYKCIDEIRESKYNRH